MSQGKLAGLVLTALLALLAVYCERLPFWPFTLPVSGVHPIDRMILGLLIGICLRQSIGLPESWGAGIGIASKQLLPLAIILMGARLDFNILLSLSVWALSINLICVIFAFTVTRYLCRRAYIPETIGILISIGTAICGGSAIVAAAPVIRAKDKETSVSVACITLVGMLAIFIYPAFAAVLGMTQGEFGIWAGTSIQAVPQVIAAGFAYGEEAGELGLLVKLVRILLLVPFILYLSMCKTTGREAGKVVWRRLVPPFVYGFIALSTASSLGWIDVATKSVLNQTSSFLIAMAMVGIGLESDLRGMLRSNLKVLLTAFIAAAILGLTSYSLIQLLGGPAIASFSE